MRRGSFHATASAAFDDGEKRVRVYYREGGRDRAAWFGPRKPLPDEHRIFRVDVGVDAVVDPHRLLDLPLEMARELADRDPVCRDSYDLLDSLRRALLMDGRLFGPRLPPLPRARALAPELANPWPDADKPHWPLLRSPSCAGYGKHDGSQSEAYAATLAQLGMRVDERGRYWATPC